MILMWMTLTLAMMTSVTPWKMKISHDPQSNSLGLSIDSVNFCQRHVLGLVTKQPM